MGFFTDMAEIQEFIEDNKNPNTKRKTISDLKQLLIFKDNLGDRRCLEEMPAQELDCLLSRFFFSLKKADGTDYEPGSLTSYQSSFMRYLKEKGYPHNIRTDQLFYSSNQVIAAKRKTLKQAGKGLRPNKSEPFTKDEVEILFEKKILGKGIMNIDKI